MTRYRIFGTARPSLVSARVVAMDPAKQWALDEISRRRAAGLLPGSTRYRREGQSA